ncbi:MAG: UPF0280 family protein [Coriobacteriia bacterium]
MTYEPRTYRAKADPGGLLTFEVVHAETDLQISASRDLRREASALVAELREELEAYLAANPYFAESLVPVDASPGAPGIVRAMADAARAADVGPMAAIAGAVAEAVARGLEAVSPEVIVENGGDLFLMSVLERRVLLGAGDSPLSERVGLVFDAGALPVAVCTSSAKVGPSLSLGSAHAATVIAEHGALADAAASSVGNLVHGPDDIERALARAMEIPGVRGAVVIAGDTLGAIGGVSLFKV